jgi:hypothetical protein
MVPSTLEINENIQARGKCLKRMGGVQIPAPPPIKSIT